jgi:hypothetical protein
MKVEEVKQITSKALEELVQALESGHSEALTAYLKTMSLFSKYSLNNLFLATARRKAGRRFSYLAEARTLRPQGRKRHRHHRTAHTPQTRGRNRSNPERARDRGFQSRAHLFRRANRW